jgi:hypothetical protein
MRYAIREQIKTKEKRGRKMGTFELDETRQQSRK